MGMTFRDERSVIPCFDAAKGVCAVPVYDVGEFRAQSLYGSIRNR
jgi:hypothetical protein